MKRCPTCDRIETDDALTFCRADGTTLVTDPSVGDESSATRILPGFQTQVIRYGAPNRYTVTGDGQRFLVNSPVEEVSQTPISVVLNWTAALKK